jgi:signal transduction histidine kinase
MLQGRLDIRSAPGRGTTVFVRIPHSIGQSG